MEKLEQLMEKNIRLDRLAREVLILSRNTLLVNLRFLDMALSEHEYRTLHIPLWM